MEVKETMSNIHMQIMFYLDKHLDGEELTWKGYDTLINLLLKESEDKEVNLISQINKLSKTIQQLKEIMCLSLSKGLTRRGKQPLPKRYPRSSDTSTTTSVPQDRILLKNTQSS